MNGTAALPSALQPIEDLISGTNGVSLDAVISSITKGANPARIVTTGYGAGDQTGVSLAHPLLHLQLMFRLFRIGALTVQDRSLYSSTRAKLSQLLTFILQPE